MTFALFAPESHDRINFSALGKRAAPPAVGDAVGVGVQSRRRVLRVVRPSRARGQKGLKEYFYGRQKEEGGEEGREGEGMREFLARGRHMPVTHRRAQERGGPTEFASSSAALKFGSFGINIFHDLVCMDCARHHLRGRRHGNVAENVFYYLPHLPRAAVRVPSPPPPLCSVLPSKFWAKTKWGAAEQRRKRRMKI